MASLVPARRTNWLRPLAVGVALVGSYVLAHAAPLDTTLTAMPELDFLRGYLELGSDHMNNELDVLKVRENDPKTAGTSAGDYHGQHLSGAVRLSDDVWLSGSLWHRDVSSTRNSYVYNSYHLAGSYRFMQATGAMPAVAVRASVWGSKAHNTDSSTPVTVPGAILNTVRITEPADQSFQLDVIGTWRLQPQVAFSALASAGVTRLTYGALSATTTRNGCNYQLAFDGNNIAGTLAEPCTSSGGVIQQFYDSSGAYGVDVANEIAWRGRFLQLGANASFAGEPWSYKVGYLFHTVRREAVDDILLARQKPSYSQNHNLSFEANYKLSPQWSLLGRVQFSSNLFFSELPVTYNSSSSDRFGSKYSLFTLAVHVAF